MKSEKEVRDEVRRAYASAIGKARRGEKRGCCEQTAPAGAAAGCAGYGEAEASEFPEAAGASFGCGNPLAFADVRRGESILDLGSGAGLDLLVAWRKVGPEGRVIGVDMTDEMIAVARENIERAGATNVEVRKGIIEELPVSDASVDRVISNCVINLSADKPAVFREIHRVLKPGGRFSISDIVAEELPEWIRREARAYAACIGGAISEADYVAGLEAAGLADVSVTDRIVYDEAQLRAVVGTDLEAFGVSPGLLDAAISQVTGKVWSARVTGRKPA